MDARRWSVAAVSVVLVVAALGRPARVGAKADPNGDPHKAAAPREATVQFAQPQPQTPDPAPVGASVTHLLVPDDVTIAKGGTVNFIVNGGGHGIAIHEVSNKTTRADIAEDFCDGLTNETGDFVGDRRNRAAVCNGVVVTPVTINGVTFNVTGTNNLQYRIMDGKG